MLGRLPMMIHETNNIGCPCNGKGGDGAAMGGDCAVVVSVGVVI